jgi:hypothetical protein
MVMDSGTAAGHRTTVTVEIILAKTRRIKKPIRAQASNARKLALHSIWKFPFGKWNIPYSK